MARVFFELSDFATLVQEIANRRRPLLTRTISNGPWPLQVQLDVVLHALESIEAAGPITVESEFQPGETWIHFQAQVPRVSLKIQCTLKRGTILIQDGDWPLEVNFHCGITGQIHLTGGPDDKPLTTASQRHIKVAFKDFQLRCEAFPQWLEHPMQRMLERMIQSMIGEMVPFEIRRPLTSSPEASSITQVAAVDQPAPALAVRQQSCQSGAVYRSAYYVAYGLTFPAAWIWQTLLRNTAAGAGLSDGAQSAAETVERLTEHWGAQPKTALNSTPEVARAPLNPVRTVTATV